MAVELGRRERAMEEEVQHLDRIKSDLEREKAVWERDRGSGDQERAAMDAERRAFQQERQAWQEEKRSLIADREAVVRARAMERQNGQMSERDRAMVEQVRAGLGGMLGKKAGVAEGEMVGAVEEVRRLLQMRENEVVKLKEEMREVNQGLEAEIKRAAEDRDGWKSKAEHADRSMSTRSADVASLEKRLRVSRWRLCASSRLTVQSQSDQINDLNLRNESLSTSLQAAQAAISSQASSGEATKALKNRIDSLTAELDSIAGQFNEVWRILPSSARRRDAELVDPKTGLPNASLSSPSRAVNFAALQRALAGLTTC
jgi:hypothetical protein